MRIHFKNSISFIKQGFNSRPWYLIFAVTGLCNQRCAMCFYWKNINNKCRKELTLREIELIGPQFDNLFQLTLSGGEPLLREDCFEIASVFATKTPVKRITLTSNGMMPERIEKFVDAFYHKFPNINLSVNLSIDGLEETHDKIRGVKGAFNKVLESFDILGDLKKKYNNLDRATATTFSALNQGQINDLLDFVENRLDIVNHGIMLARGDISNPSLSDITYDIFYEAIISLFRRNRKKTGVMNESINNVYQRRRINSLKTNKMLDPCLAGKKILILNEEGMLTPCELLEHLRLAGLLKRSFNDDFSYGNLRDFNYNLNSILSTAKAKKINDFIKNRNCSCSFECAMINNFFLNPYNYLRITGDYCKGLVAKNRENI